MSVVTSAAAGLRCVGSQSNDHSSSTVHARLRCAAGAHVVFIASNGLASSVMRARLPVSMLEQTNRTHGVRATMCGPPCNATHLERHLDKHGDASACLVVKYATRQVHDFCRARGMLVVLDSVDNYRGFEERSVRDANYQTIDAMLVQTREHAEWLAARAQLRSVVLPHPHGNLNAWNSRTNNDKVRPHVRGVGLLVGDAWRNLPNKETTTMLAAACCASNATLIIVYSTPGHSVYTKRLHCPQPDGRGTCASPCPNATHMRRLEHSLQQHGGGWRSSHGRRSTLQGGVERGGVDGRDGGDGVDWSTHGLVDWCPIASSGAAAQLSGIDSAADVLLGTCVSSARASTRAPPVSSPPSSSSSSFGLEARGGGDFPMWPWPGGEFDDVARQRRYYERHDPNQSLHDEIDVALLWLPGNQLGTNLAIANRPPTRLAWWWSHGVPTLGYPMVAYVEAAQRAGYPRQLLNLTRPTDIVHALCAISRPATRKCLRSHALRGAALTSPQYSALELVVGLCAVAEQCAPGKRLRKSD